MIVKLRAYVNEYELVETFNEAIGGSSDIFGAWNADKTRFCYSIDRNENTMQHEQDWIAEYCPSNYENITSNIESIKKSQINLGEMLQFLILNGKIEKHAFFLVGTR